MENKELLQEVRELLGHIDSTHRYSMANITRLYNLVFGEEVKPTPSQSILLGRVRSLREWEKELSRVKARVVKLQERHDALHPNNIEEGAEYEGYLVDVPRVGECFRLAGFNTSIVQEIVDENTFKTYNSIYRWEIIQKFKNRELCQK